MAMFSVPDFSEYLRFCCSANLRQNQQDFYTPISASLRLQAQSVVSSQSSPESNPAQEEKKRMDVLVGLRQYALEHILLVGKPGSGKSTALKQLLWESAQQYLETEIQAKRENLTIPVLIELRDCREGMVLDWLHRALRRANLTKDIIETLLSRQHFLLLFDGLNELPSSEVRAELGRFRRDYADVPMIFTTRELGAGEDLGIKKKLEMVPLSEAQMQRFIEARLPGRADALLKQLQGRLQELAETPLLLWMLCEVFAEEQQIPRNRGELFRRHFTQKYDQFKQARSLPISEDSRRLTSILLQQLAFEMMQGNTPTEFRLQITISEARQILEAFLRFQGEVSPASRAGEYLEDLLEFHILQLASDPNKIEFHHQLFQEYYAAECLLPQLSRLNDEQLKCHYLNYLKWTESIALLLALLEDKTEALRVVELALQVDLKLGARLAGEVKSAFQQQTIDLLTTIKIPREMKTPVFSFSYLAKMPKWLNIELLGETRSGAVVSSLFKALEYQNPHICWSAALALAKIGGEVVLEKALKVLEHHNPTVRQAAVAAISRIGTEKAVAGLLKAVKDSDGIVRLEAEAALGQIGGEAAVAGLLKILEQSNSSTNCNAISALGRIGSEVAVARLIEKLKDSNWFVRKETADALGGIGSRLAVKSLLEILEDTNSEVRWIAVSALGKIGGEEAIQALLKALELQDSLVRKGAIYALGKIGGEVAVEKLRKLLEDPECTTRSDTAYALGEIGSEVAIEGLCKLLRDSEPSVRASAAYALGKIGDKVAIEGLCKLLRDSESNVRASAASALGEIGCKAVVEELCNLLEDSESNVRASAAYALGEIGCETSVISLLKALKKCHSGADVNESRVRVVEALGKIGGEAATLGILQALEDSDVTVRIVASESLAKSGDKAIIQKLFKTSKKDPVASVREYATKALGQVQGDKTAQYLSQLRTLIFTKVDYQTLESISSIQQQCRFYNYEIYLQREKVENRIRRIEDEEVRQIIYQIGSVGNLNMGSVTIHGNQIETK